MKYRGLIIFQEKERFVLQRVTSFEDQAFLWDIGSLLVILEEIFLLIVSLCNAYLCFVFQVISNSFYTMYMNSFDINKPSICSMNVSHYKDHFCVRIMN